MLCDSVTILDRGRLKYSGPMEGLLAHSEEVISYELALVADHPDAIAAVGALDGITEIAQQDGESRYTLSFDQSKLDASAILRTLLDAGAGIASIAPARKHLDEAFMDLTEPGVPE